MGFSKKKREEVHGKYNGCCSYCGQDIAYSDMQVDHIIPKSNFETTIHNKYRVPKFLNHLTLEDVNHIDNLNPSCRRCNKFKDSMDLETFREELQKQLERAETTSANFRRALQFGQVIKTPRDIVFHFEKSS